MSDAEVGVEEQVKEATEQLSMYEDALQRMKRPRDPANEFTGKKEERLDTYEERVARAALIESKVVPRLTAILSSLRRLAALERVYEAAKEFEVKTFTGTLSADQVALSLALKAAEEAGRG